MKIYCPQVDSKVECDCFDKCDEYKVGLKMKMESLFQDEISKADADTIYLTELSLKITKIIDS